MALEWSENFAVATVTSTNSGEPAILFSIELEYDQRPTTSDVSFGWTIFDLDTGEELGTYSFYRSTTLTGGALRLSFASARIPITPGKRYRGRANIDDFANDLHHQRDIDYTAPLVLPVGIILRGANGAEEIGLDGVPDEELEEMATAYDLLQSEYSQVAEDTTLDAFFSDYATGSEGFPAAVYLIPLQGNESTFGTEGSPVTFRITPVMYAYPVPDRGAVSDLLEQLSVYERDFVGFVFEGEGDEALFGARFVFVGEIAWRVLAAAKDEERDRATP